MNANQRGEKPARLLTVGEVASYVRKPISWVYQAAGTGELPSMKVGRNLRFHADEISAWLNNHRHGRGTVEPHRPLLAEGVTADDLAQFELTLDRIETKLDAVLTGRGA